METPELVGLVLHPLAVNRRAPKLDLSLSIMNAAEGLTGSLEYDTDLFDATTITRMLEHFQILLEGIVANPEQCLSDLPLLTDAERQQLLVEWNIQRPSTPRSSASISSLRPRWNGPLTPLQ